MKKIFILPAIIILSFTTNILKAQNCDFADAGVRFNYSYINPANGNCVINLDLYFDLKTNDGSKYVLLHIWPVSVYPDLMYSNPPDSTQLAGAATLVIHHFQNHTYSHMDTVYKPDTRVKPQYMDMVLSIGPSTINADYDRFSITNINLEVAGSCNIPEAFKLDMWSTESESMNQVHCLDKGTVFYANNPRINALMSCQIPRTFNVQINSIDPIPINLKYDVYIDNGDNVFNVLEDTLNIKSDSGIILGSTNYNSGIVSYLPYSSQYPYANMSLWVVASSPTLPNTIIALIENSCAALPVKLVSFNAKNKGESVLLTWITAGEFSNKGFTVERKTGNGDWQSIGFVNSKAEQGNSQLKIDYSYTDYPGMKAVFQYRLKQLDADGNFTYSPVRVIKNEGNEAVVIFPNPSSGNVNIVLPGNDLQYNVTVYNSDGKKIRAWQNCNTILNIYGMRPGIYMVSIEENQSKAVSNHKIVIH